MADSTDIEALRSAVLDLVAVVKDSNETTRLLIEAARGPVSTSATTIHAGGVTSAIAVCVSLTSVVVMMLFSIWLMWQQAEQKSQQEAWIQVWQQRIANELRKDDAH